MNTEIEILKTDLKNLFAFQVQNHLCRQGWRLTGEKFFIMFAGSKGYMSHIQISSEGKQIHENRLFIHDLQNKNGSFKKKLVNIYYSEAKGVRISLGKDSPQTFKAK